MPRIVQAGEVRDHESLRAIGLAPAAIAEGISRSYDVLDTIDSRLLERGFPRLASLLELVNLSAVVGNLLRWGIARASDGRFRPNRPHAYPDLIASAEGCSDIEIKVALETNKPKGHLAKPGPHLTCRYVLGREDGAFTVGKPNRGDVVWIWEIRVGSLGTEHFNLSNTPGDSGKTATINTAGMTQLELVYCNLGCCPYAPKGRLYKGYRSLFEK